MFDRELDPTTTDAERVQTPAHPISLADVIGLGVVPHWTEAVAVVEELCAILPVDEGGVVLVPEAPDVAITSRGSVIVRKGAGGVADVHALGRLLYALLDPGTAPMALRLFAAHATSAGGYATVRGFAEALTYYARPGRGELIRALYERCLDVPLEATSAGVDVSAHRAAGEAPQRRLSRRTRVVGALAICAGAAWAWDADRISSTLTGLQEVAWATASTVLRQLQTLARPDAPDMERSSESRTAGPESRAATGARPIPDVVSSQAASSASVSSASDSR